MVTYDLLSLQSGKMKRYYTEPGDDREQAAGSQRRKRKPGQQNSDQTTAFSGVLGATSSQEEGLSTADTDSPVVHDLSHITAHWDRNPSRKIHHELKYLKRKTKRHSGLHRKVQLIFTLVITQCSYLV